MSGEKDGDFNDETGVRDKPENPAFTGLWYWVSFFQQVTRSPPVQSNVQRPLDLQKIRRNSSTYFYNYRFQHSARQTTDSDRNVIDSPVTPASEESRAPDSPVTPASEESRAPDSPVTPASEESRAPDSPVTPASDESRAIDSPISPASGKSRLTISAQSLDIDSPVSRSDEPRAIGSRIITLTRNSTGRQPLTRKRAERLSSVGGFLVARHKRYASGINVKLEDKRVDFYEADYSPSRNVMEVLLGQPDLVKTCVDFAKSITEQTIPREYIAALHMYTMESSFYESLNATMREGTDEERSKYRDYIYYLNKSLEQLLPFKGPVYRGLNCLVEQYTPGSILTWNAYSSATSNPMVAIEFVGNTLRGTLFMIDSITARPIMKYSAHPEEEETLFPPNSKFEVVSLISPAHKKILSAALKLDLTDLMMIDLKQIS